MLDVARMAVDAARRAGADFADARAGTDETESLTVRNQEMEGIDRETSTGVGVRVLVGGRWGFAATSRLDEAEVTRTAELAVQIAKAAQRLPGDPVRLSPVEPAVASWRSAVAEDPFTVPLEEKVALLMEATRRMQTVPGVTFAEGGLDFFRRSTWFASSDGAGDRPGRDAERRRDRGGRGRRGRHAAPLATRTRSAGTSRRPGTSTSARSG